MFIAVLPLVLFLYLVQTTERTQVFFLGRIHTFRIPQKESYIVTESERAPEMSIKECEMRNTSRRIVEAKRFVQFMAVPYSSPKGLIKSVAELTSMYTSKQLVVSNSKVRKGLIWIVSVFDLNVGKVEVACDSDCKTLV